MIQVKFYRQPSYTQTQCYLSFSNVSASFHIQNCYSTTFCSQPFVTISNHLQELATTYCNQQPLSVYIGYLKNFTCTCVFEADPLVFVEHLNSVSFILYQVYTLYLNTYIYTGMPFNRASLQPGLINSGLLCYLNSIIIFLHRINFLGLLDDDLHGGGDHVISLVRQENYGVCQNYNQ